MCQHSFNSWLPKSWYPEADTKTETSEMTGEVICANTLEPPFFIWFNRLTCYDLQPADNNPTPNDQLPSTVTVDSVLLVAT